MTDDVRVSVVINTLNEEARLPWALGSVQSWADEIVVVDMHSDDRTVEIAESFGAKVFEHPRTGFVEPARAFAIGKATGNWILLLDADEMVPKSTATELLAIANRGDADVVIIPFRCFFFGREMKGGGWSIAQDHHERFFRPSHIRLSTTVHVPNRAAPDARVMTLSPDPKYAFVHFNYVDTTQFIEKLNRYTTIESRSEQDRGSIRRGFALAIREFFARYIRHRGYRDGWRGLYLAAALSFYRLTSAAKRLEADSGGPAEVEAGYRRLAESILSEYSSDSPTPSG